MTAYTSSQAGNWSASATWGGAGVPGIGDTASIGHDVTVDVDTTVGTSGIAGTSDVTFTAAKTLAISNNVSFWCRSDLTLVGPVGGTAVGLTLGQGSKYYFDGSVSNVSYKIKMGTASNQAVRVTGAGVAGNRFRFESLGTAAGGFTAGGGVAGQCSFYYGTFVNVNLGLMTFNGNIGTTPTQDVRFCDFDANCTTLRFGTMGATSSNLFENNTFRQTSTAGVNWTQGWASGATKTFKNNFFLGGNATFTNLGNGPAFIENNYFGGALGLSQSGATAATSTIIRNNTFWRSAGTDQLVSADFTGNYYGYRSTVGANPHGIQMTGTAGVTRTVSDNIFENTGTATDGDMITPGAPGVAVTLVVTNNINLPNGAGNSSGTLLSLLGDINWTVRADHNTYYVSGNGTGHITIGETYAPGHVGFVTSIRSNLAWKSVSGAHADTYNDFANNVLTDGIVTVVGYQGRWNLTGNHYNTQSVGDVATDAGGYVTCSANPFQDSTRNIGKFDQLLGGPGTGDNAWLEFAKVNDDAGYNTSYNGAALYAYIRDGFKVTDAALNNAGHDGVTIGAMGYVASAPAGATGGRGRRSVPVFYHIINQLGAHLSWVKNLFARRRPWRDRNLAYG